MKKLDVLAIFGIAICIGVIAGLGISVASYVRIGHLQQMYEAAITAQASANHAADVTAEKAATKQKLGTVNRGEGIETAFIRQLIADPSLCDGSKICPSFSGNRNDPAALRQWAGRAAHILACKAGYADCKYGMADIRVATPDTISYVIQKTANGIQIAEYRVDAPSPTSFSASVGGEKLATTATVLIRTRLAATTIAASQFLGLPDIVNKLPNYEYRHIG